MKTFYYKLKAYLYH